MTCEEAKKYFMDYLYQEIDDEHQELVEAHLNACNACRDEIAALKSTSDILQSYEALDPKLNLIFVKESRTVWQKLREKVRDYVSSGEHWGRRLAYGLAIILIVFSLINMEISWENGHFSLKTSLWPHAEKEQAQQSAITKNNLIEFQKDQILLMNQLIEASEAKQRRELILTLADFTQELEHRRQSDLMLVGTSMEQLQLQTNQRLQLTNESINGLFKLINVQSTAQDIRR